MESSHIKKLQPRIRKTWCNQLTGWQQHPSCHGLGDEVFTHTIQGTDVWFFFSWKRGRSWHVACVISRTGTDATLEMECYVHLFNACIQNWYAVGSIIKDVLKNEKKKSNYICSLFKKRQCWLLPQQPAAFNLTRYWKKSWYWNKNDITFQIHSREKTSVTEKLHLWKGISESSSMKSMM